MESYMSDEAKQRAELNKHISAFVRADSECATLQQQLNEKRRIRSTARDTAITSLRTITRDDPAGLTINTPAGQLVFKQTKPPAGSMTRKTLQSAMEMLLTSPEGLALLAKKNPKGIVDFIWAQRPEHEPEWDLLRGELPSPP